MYENKKALGTGDNNDSSINTNSIATAQDYNSSRSNKGSLMVSTGFSTGNKNSTVSKGISFKVAYQIPIAKSIHIEAGADYFLNDFNYIPSNALPEKYIAKLKKDEQNNKWNSFAITVGPSLTIGHSSLRADVYDRAGILFIKGQKKVLGVANQNSETTEASGLARFPGSSAMAAYDIGLSLHYNITQHFGLFLEPYFLSSFKKNIIYSEKDASLAIDADGNFNKDLFAKLPYLPKRFAFENYGIDLGIKIDCF